MKSVRRWMLVACCLAIAAGAYPAAATEPVDTFLAALRARRYFDEAGRYLDQLAASTSVPDEVRERIPYERAVTLLAEATVQDDPQVRRTRLSQAAELFDKFCAEKPQHALVSSARAHLANILLERGRAELQGSGDSAQRAAAARDLFEQARKQFASAEKQLDAELDKMPKLVPADDKQRQARKWQLASDLAQARLLQASVDYELAKTYEPASKEAQERYEAAAKSYAALYQQYRTRGFGLLARLWEGRCHQELGKFKEAVGCYRELMDLPDSAETLSIRTKATRQALECWTSEKVKQYQAAIERGERWEQEGGKETADVDAQAIRYLIAVAYQEQAEALPASDPNRKRLTSSARDRASPLARQPGAFQQSAKTLLVALSGGKTADKQAAAPKNFSEALLQAREALAQMQDASTALIAAEQKQDKPTAEKMQAQKEASATEAIRLLRLALSLRDAETPPEELDTARHYLCFACWETGRYYDAAVLGEYLADHAPETLAGRQGGKIAMASWVRLYEDSKDDDRSFEVAQIQRVAELIFDRWPDQQEAEDAALTLVNFAAAADQVDKAVEYLNKISETSPRRGPAELRAGQALWSSYLRALRLPPAERPAPEKLQAFQSRAQEVLERGIARVEKSGPVDATLATAVFSLAQICLETGQADKSIGWLTHPRFGALTLVAKNDPAAARPGFAVESQKMAMRAYIAATPQRLEEAEKAMGELEKLVKASKDPKADDNLTAIYIGLGRQLQQNLTDLRSSGNTQELERMSKAFQVFLDRIAARQAGGDYATLNWIGETYYNLGSSFVEGSVVSPAAQAYFGKAAAAYRPLLAMAAKDPKFKQQPEALLGIRMKLAECYARGGKFDDAIGEISTVLTEKPTLLAAQVKAAEFYQAKGAQKPEAYAQAIIGGAPDRQGRNLIWGWTKISAITRNRPEFVDTFHQSRLSIAECRYLYAHVQKDAERKKKVLEAGIGDLWSTYKAFPELGGPQTAARYDEVLKRIQKALGEEQSGLAGFKKRDAESAAATN